MPLVAIFLTWVLGWPVFRPLLSPDQLRRSSRHQGPSGIMPSIAIFLTFLSSTWSGLSYDPCAGCLRDDSGALRNGSGRNVEPLRLKPVINGPVSADWRCNPYYTWLERRDGKCCRPHAGPLLEIRSPEPPPEVLPPLDALRWTGSTVVERGRRAPPSSAWYKQNSEREMRDDSILAFWTHGKGMRPIVLYKSYS